MSWREDYGTYILYLYIRYTVMYKRLNRPPTMEEVQERSDIWICLFSNYMQLLSIVYTRNLFWIIKHILLL
jgi:hypothetical protein